MENEKEVLIEEKPIKNKGGRPVKNFDQHQFESLCAMHCTEVEICSFFGTNDHTLNNWCKRTYGKGFFEIHKEKVQLGNVSLRRIQYRMAEKNPTMAIFLGKQYLGQKDKVEDVSEKEIMVNVSLIKESPEDSEC